MRINEINLKEKLEIIKVVSRRAEAGGGVRVTATRLQF